MYVLVYVYTCMYMKIRFLSKLIYTHWVITHSLYAPVYTCTYLSSYMYMCMYLNIGLAYM